MVQWHDIKTVPKDGSPVRFRHASGEEFLGTWAPFWCGSDCPCDVTSEGEEPFDQEPDCWCAYRIGSKTGEEQTPTHWSIQINGE